MAVRWVGLVFWCSYHQTNLGRVRFCCHWAARPQGLSCSAIVRLDKSWASSPQLDTDGVLPLEEFNSPFHREGIQSPMEGHSGYRGANWSPERLAFHQNLETFADRIGLIVGLQANGKIAQDQAFAEIRSLWSQLKASSKDLLNEKP